CWQASSTGRTAVSEAADSTFKSWSRRQIFPPLVQWRGHELAELEIGVRLAGGGPTERSATERRATSSPTGEVRDCLACQLYRVQAGSIPVRSAKLLGSSSNGRIAGLQPADASSTLAGPTILRV